MKVLLYNDTYKHLGGAETYCLELLSRLPDFGHEVYWLAHGEESARAAHHIVLPTLNAGRINYFYSKYFYNDKAYRIYKKELNRIQPDVVHIHHDRYYTFSLAKALQELQIPVIQTIHDYTMLCPSQYYPDLYYKKTGTKCRKDHCKLICSQGSCLPWTKRIGHPFAHDRKRKIVQKNIPNFIAPSTQLKSYLERAGFQNVHYLPFFVDENKWSFDSKRMVENVVLFVGRVETNKGIHLLIDAMKAVRKTIPTTQLQIAGTGEQVENIKQRIQAENLGNWLELLGFVPYDTIQNCYTGANVLVVPSLDMEQFGLIGIEALASGTAVIGSDTGGIPEWCIHEKTGLLFDAEQPEKLSSYIIQLLNNKNLREQLVQNGMQLIREKFNTQQHFEQLINLYQQAKPIKGE